MVKITTIVIMILAATTTTAAATATAAIVIAAVIHIDLLLLLLLLLLLVGALSCVSIHRLSPRQKCFFPSPSIATVMDVDVDGRTILGQITSGDGGGG